MLPEQIHPKTVKKNQDRYVHRVPWGSRNGHPLSPGVRYGGDASKNRKSREHGKERGQAAGAKAGEGESLCGVCRELPAGQHGWSMKGERRLRGRQGQSYRAWSATKR